MCIRRRFVPRQVSGTAEELQEYRPGTPPVGRLGRCPEGSASLDQSRAREEREARPWLNALTIVVPRWGYRACQSHGKREELITCSYLRARAKNRAPRALSEYPKPVRRAEWSTAQDAVRSRRCGRRAVPIWPVPQPYS